MNTKTIRTVMMALVVLGTLATGVTLWAATTIPSGTVVKVRLQNSVSSASAKSGQEFSAVLDQAVTVAGKTIAPKGANVKGIVSKAVASGRLSTPAELYLRLNSLEINGKSYALQTGSVGRKGESHKKRDAVGIGGGAALGATIGAIAGGGKGAAIGAGAGAAAGTAGAAATGKKDISYPVETPLSFTLRSAVTVP